MKCPKCKSTLVRVQTINEVELKNDRHGVLWWLFIGWWWVPVKWIHFTVLALIFKLFGRKSKRRSTAGAPSPPARTAAIAGTYKK